MRLFLRPLIQGHINGRRKLRIANDQKVCAAVFLQECFERRQQLIDALVARNTADKAKNNRIVRDRIFFPDLSAPDRLLRIVKFVQIDAAGTAGPNHRAFIFRVQSLGMAELQIPEAVRLDPC